MWYTIDVESLDVILDRDQRTTSHRVLVHKTPSGSSIAPGSSLGRLRQQDDSDDDVDRHAEMANTRTELNDLSNRHLQNNSHIILMPCDDRGRVRSRNNSYDNVLTWLSKWKWLMLSKSSSHASSTFFFKYIYIYIYIHTYIHTPIARHLLTINHKQTNIDIANTGTLIHAYICVCIYIYINIYIYIMYIHIYIYSFLWQLIGKKTI